jgi:hypothetical protein
MHTIGIVLLFFSYQLDLFLRDFLLILEQVLFFIICRKMSFNVSDHFNGGHRQVLPPHEPLHRAWKAIHSGSHLCYKVFFLLSLPE